MRKSKYWDIIGAVGMLVGILTASYSWVTTFFDAPPIISDWRWGVGIGLLIFFLSVSIFIYKLYGVFAWSEPNMILTPKTDEKHGSRNFFPRIARLEVYNDEQIEITDCYVTLENAQALYQTKDMIFIDSIKNERLTWKDNRYSNDRCEITIPPKKSMDIDVLDTTNSTHFTLCSHTNLIANGSGERLFLIKIRIDGKLNTKSIKPQYFEGYLYVENIFDMFEATETTSEQVGNGEIKRTEREIRERVVYTNMIFEEGNWMKNQELKNRLGLKNRNQVIRGQE